MADGDGRRRAGRQSAGHPARPAQARRRDPGRDLCRQDQEMERPENRAAQSRHEPARQGDRAGVPLGRFGHDVHLHRLPVEGRSRVQAEGRLRHLGAVPDRDRRQGQRGRRRDDGPHRRRDRLCRVCLCAAEQDDLHADEEPGRQVRRPGNQGLSGRRRRRRLEQRARFRRRADQPAGRRELADHRRHLHPDAQNAEGPAEGQAGARLLRLGLPQRRPDGAGAALRSDAGKGDRRRSRKCGRRKSSARTESRYGPARPPEPRRMLSIENKRPLRRPGGCDRRPSPDCRRTAAARSSDDGGNDRCGRRGSPPAPASAGCWPTRHSTA